MEKRGPEEKNADVGASLTELARRAARFVLTFDSADSAATMRPTSTISRHRATRPAQDRRVRVGFAASQHPASAGN